MRRAHACHESRAYVLLEWPGEDLRNLAPVLSRLFHCPCFLLKKSPPLTVWWMYDECRAAFSTTARSSSSPVRGADRVRSWDILKGSGKGAQPAGNENVLWCLMGLPGSSLVDGSMGISELFGGSTVAVAAIQTTRSDT